MKVQLICYILILQVSYDKTSAVNLIHVQMHFKIFNLLVSVNNFSVQKYSKYGLHLCVVPYYLLIFWNSYYFYVFILYVVNYIIKIIFILVLVILVLTALHIIFIFYFSSALFQFKVNRFLKVLVNNNNIGNFFLSLLELDS